jgi:hypothetical protein
MAYLVAVRKRVEQELGVDDLVMIQHCVPLVAATIGETPEQLQISPQRQ